MHHYLYCMDGITPPIPAAHRHVPAIRIDLALSTTRNPLFVRVYSRVFVAEGLVDDSELDDTRVASLGTQGLGQG